MNRELFATTVLPQNELDYLHAGAEWWEHYIHPSRPSTDPSCARTYAILRDRKDATARLIPDDNAVFASVLDLGTWQAVQTYLRETGRAAIPPDTSPPNPTP